jgi:hypothetical protein
VRKETRRRTACEGVESRVLTRSLQPWVPRACSLSAMRQQVRLLRRALLITLWVWTRGHSGKRQGRLCRTEEGAALALLSLAL